MAWNLWLDDERDPKLFLNKTLIHSSGLFDEFRFYDTAGMKAEDFIWCKSMREAIDLITDEGMPEFMALDHDLGDHTTMNFLKHIAHDHPDVKFKWHCHSANPNGALNIKAFLESFFKSQEK